MARIRPPRRQIVCPTVRGEPRSFPAEQVRWRPAAYGVAVVEGRVLLGRSVFTGRWELPGGGVEPWESLAEGLEREFEEESGLRPRLLEPVHFAEGYVSFFDHAFHSLRYYFLVEVPGDGPLHPQEGELTELAWLDPGDPALAVGPDDREAIRKALLRLGLEPPPA
ncbi:MAG: NUDIX domain-containing protein [Bacillota bacterium]|nr:NUDIX domain-containing protein [Bacillota bacterium]